MSIVACRTPGCSNVAMSIVGKCPGCRSEQKAREKAKLDAYWRQQRAGYRASRNYWRKAARKPRRRK